MSAPAAKAFAEPVRTMAEMEGSLSRAEVQVLSSLIKGEKRAFRALGLFRVTVVFPISSFAMDLVLQEQSTYSEQHPDGEC